MKVIAHGTVQKAGINGVVLRPIDDATPSESTPHDAGNVKIRLDYRDFAFAYGGEWANRLVFWSYPACYLTSPGRAGCQDGRPLLTKRRGSMIITALTGAQAIDTSRVYVAQAAAASASGSGDYAASPMTASSSWTAGGSGGGFSWEYPLDVTSSRGGIDPDLSISYDSQEPDGRTSTTNNQSSRIGEGFQLAESYIERSYATCKDDGVAGKSDMCWSTDNGILVLNGVANELVKVSSVPGVTYWRLKHDDGSRVLRYQGSNRDNNNETWQVTTPDGTTYTFGMSNVPGQTADSNAVWTVPVAGNDAGEPCYDQGDSFGKRFCAQAWRWNLDDVKDLDGNEMTYSYTRDTNYYNQNGGTGVLYDNGGYLDKITYGLRPPGETLSAPLRVVFNSKKRCTAIDSNPDLCTTYSDAARWPDVPTDQICGNASCTGHPAPTFFSTWRIKDIRNQIYLGVDDKDGKVWEDISVWSVETTFKTYGDSDTSVLFPDRIVRTEKQASGSVTMPPVVFGAATFPNRVASSGDPIGTLDRYRLVSVVSESGARTTVSYGSGDSTNRCTTASLPPDSFNNHQFCYGQRWIPPGQSTSRIDFWRKYVVNSVTSQATYSSAPDLVSSYEYYRPSWILNDDPTVATNYRQFSVYRGVRRVTTTEGSGDASKQLQTVDTYLQGIDGDDVPIDSTHSFTDRPQYAGFQLLGKTKTSAATDASVISTVVTKPWSARTGDSTRANEHDAYYVRLLSSSTRETTADGSLRERRLTYTYNDLTGMTRTVSDDGDVDKSGDESCVSNRYVSNRSTTYGTTWILAVLQTSVTSKGVCGTDPDAIAPYTMLAATRISYETDAGGAPTRGVPIKQERVSGFLGTAAQWQTTSTTSYDNVGRPTAVATRSDTDKLVPTTTNYEDTFGQTTKTVVTTTANGTTYTAVSDLNPKTGSPLSVRDANGSVTTYAYDGAGRLTNVWLPNRTQGQDSASVAYDYSVSNVGPSWVKTSTMTADAVGYATSYTFYDAYFRQVQTQTPTPTSQGGASGRSVTSTTYNTIGKTSRYLDQMVDATPPSPTMVDPVSMGQLDSQTGYTYDGLGRPVTTTLVRGSQPRWSTTTTYGGLDTQTVTPPTGAPPVTTTTDALGRVVRRVEKGAAGGSDLAIDYDYDERGKLTKMVGPSGTWTYTYDVLGNQIEVDDPDTGTVSTEYTPADHVAISTDARGKVLQRTYDDLGRQTGLYDSRDASTDHLLSQWTFDDSTISNGKGRLAATIRNAPDGTSFKTTVTGYNSVGSPTGSSLAISNPTGGGIATGLPTSYATSTTYAADGTTPRAVTMPAIGAALDAETVTYLSNNLGQTTELRGTDLRVLTAYDSFSRPGTVTLGDLTTSSVSILNTYDVGTDRLENQYAVKLNPRQVQSNHTYTYDNAGNPLSDSDSTPGNAETQCYRYDDHRRLAQAWTPASLNCGDVASATSIGGPAPYYQMWKYDEGKDGTGTQVRPATGHRTAQVSKVGTSSDAARTTTYTYGGSGQPANALTATTTGSASASYAYDASGNTTTRTNAASAQSLAWNAQGQVASITPDNDGNNKTTFIYGADGTTLLRDNSAEKVLYLGSTEVHLKKAGSVLSAVRRYASAMGTVAVRNSDSGLVFTLPNQQNTASVALDTNGNAIQRRWFTPFGEDRSSGSPQSWIDQRAFLNMTRDGATGLTDVGARQYDPLIGRFVSPDPLLDTSAPAGQLAYAYAADNPVTSSDPSGLRPPCADEGTCTYTPSPSGNGTGTTKALHSGSHSIGGYYVGPIGGSQGIIDYYEATTSIGAWNMHIPGPIDGNVHPGVPEKSAGFGRTWVKLYSTDWGRSGPYWWASELEVDAKDLAANSGKLGCGAWYCRAYNFVVGLAAPAIPLIAASSGAKGERGGVPGRSRAVATGSADATTTRLQGHVDQAVADYDSGAISMTRKQARAVARNPNLEPTFRGQVIDRAVKNAVRNDPALRHLWVSRSGEFGPDFHDVDSNTWWDVTTPAQWQRHVNQYTDPFGQGIGLFTQ